MSASAIKTMSVPAARPTSRFRPDIQGLRAVAVMVVLLFHANAPFLTGGFVGVDVFFVISGYLITGILIREATATGRIGLREFYAKRVRRILPAATVVLLTTALLTVAFLPQIRWQSIGIEIGAAAFYVVNWVLAANTDYLNAEIAASPLQHFWTLAVEEQFYIVWPLIIVAILSLGRRVFRTRSRVEQLRILLPAGVVLLFLPSLLWSVVLTRNDPAPAYFDTTTRLWELAVGAMVAVFASSLERIPDKLGYLLGAIGLIGIAAASFFYGPSTTFPGAAALLPTLSAAALIVGGMGGRANKGTGALLSVKPMRWIGDISYSLYLWHWPLIVVATYLLGGTLRFREGLIVIALAFIPSWLSYKYIENPFRDWERLKRNSSTALKVGGSMVAVSALVGALTFVLPGALSSSAAVNSAPLGAMALQGGADKPPEELLLDNQFVPSAIDAREDNPVVYENGCHADQGITRDPGCTLGTIDSNVTVALVGDSHAASWVPAMQNLAQDNDWKLRVFTKSACGFADVTGALSSGDPYENCIDWNGRVMDILLDERPDIVVTTNAALRNVWEGVALSPDESTGPFSDGLHRTWSTLNTAGIPVVVIKDVPRMGIDIPECVSAHVDDLQECAVPRSKAIESQPSPEATAVDGLEMTSLIDMNDWICPDDLCAPIIGHVLVWRDGHHLTATYSSTLSAPLSRALESTDVFRTAMT